MAVRKRGLSLLLRISEFGGTKEGIVTSVVNPDFFCVRKAGMRDRFFNSDFLEVQKRGCEVLFWISEFGGTKAGI